MKHLRWLALVLILALAAPLAVFAQDGDMPEMDEFVSEDELLTFNYPKAWFPVVDEETPFPAVFVVNTEEGAARLAADKDPISGDQAILVAVTPTDFLAFLGLTVTPETTVLELTQAMTDSLFSEPSEGVDPEDMVIGEVEELVIDEESGLSLGSVAVADPFSEGAYFVTFLGEDLVLLGFAASFPGEFTEELAELAIWTLLSVEYAGTGADIMAAVMAGAGGDTGTGETVLDGAVLVETRCTTCHTAERITAKVADEAGWTETVDRMISYGASLNDDERAALIAYLAGGASTSMAAPDGATLVATVCTACHSDERIVSKDKDEAGWTATVDRMISNGASLTAEERDVVIAYLVATY